MSRTIPMSFFAVALAASVVASAPAAQAADAALRYRSYVSYFNAVQASRLAEAKELLAKSRLDDLKGLNDAKALAALTQLSSPLENLQFRKETLNGNETTLFVTGKFSQKADEWKDANGIVKMVLDHNDWKVLSEQWKRVETLKEKPPTPAQLDAIKKLHDAGYPTPSDEDFVQSAVFGQLSLIKLFLQAGIPIESRVGQGSTALIESARGHEDAALYLIQQGADVNAFSDTSMTALMFASQECGMTNVVKALLAKGARLDIEDAIDGKTALQMAEEAKCTANAALIRAAVR